MQGRRHGIVARHLHILPRCTKCINSIITLCRLVKNISMKSLVQRFKKHDLKKVRENIVNGWFYQAIFLSCFTFTSTVAVILLPLSSTSNSPVL